MDKIMKKNNKKKKTNYVYILIAITITIIVILLTCGSSKKEIKDESIYSVIYDDHQEVQIIVSDNSYEDIVLQKGIDAKIVFVSLENKLNENNKEILIEKYNIKKELSIGEIVIEFNTNTVEEIELTNKNKTIKNKIKIIDKIDKFPKMEKCDVDQKC